MIEDFIESALIIDDIKAEITGLKNALEEKEILVKYYTPNELKEDGPILKNRKIIFLDLYVEEGKNLTTNISIIRSILKRRIGLNYGTYGIVLWSKHPEDVETFKSKISNDSEQYTLPIFITNLEKNTYLQSGNYNNIILDLNQKISQSSAANFFIHWDNLVKKGKENAIQNVYSLIPNYENQDQDLKYILLRLAQNQTGLNSELFDGYDLESDAIKAFSKMLQNEIIIANSNNSLGILDSPNELNFSGDDEKKKAIFSEINSKLLIDFSHLNQNVIMPGNVYEIIEDSNSYSIDNPPDGSTKIVIEVTPPCDFSINKKAGRSRILGGFYCDEPSTNQKRKFKGQNFYKEIDAVDIGMKKQQYIRFDFRYFSSVTENELKDSEKYKLIFRVKDNLFADILQKLSSHTARLGLAIIK